MQHVRAQAGGATPATVADLLWQRWVLAGLIAGGAGFRLSGRDGASWPRRLVAVPAACPFLRAAFALKVGRVVYIATGELIAMHTSIAMSSIEPHCYASVLGKVTDRCWVSAAGYAIPSSGRS